MDKEIEDFCPIRRANNQYKDIEKFKKFELTECIAFELAVRASKDTLLELIKLKTQNYSSQQRTKIKNLKKVLKEEYWIDPKYFFPYNKNYLPTKDFLLEEINRYGRGYLASYSLWYAYHYSFLEKGFTEEFVSFGREK